MDTCVHRLELKADVRIKWLKNVKDQVKSSPEGIKLPNKLIMVTDWNNFKLMLIIIGFKQLLSPTDS